MTCAANTPSKRCEHREAHAARVDVHYLEDIKRFQINVRVECSKCGRKFQFLGLPIGLDTEGGAFISADGEELRVAAAPVGTVPQPLDKALATGFRLRMPGDH